MILIKEEVVMYISRITETTPFLSLTIKKLEGPGIKLQNYTVFFVYAPYIYTPCNGKGHHVLKIKLHLILVSTQKEL